MKYINSLLEGVIGISALIWLFHDNTNVQDVLWSVQNKPGTSDEVKSWRRLKSLDKRE